MRLLPALATLLFTLPAYGAEIIIFNGLAPPNPENVIDASDDYQFDEVVVYARNEGCGLAHPWGSCFSPGDPTTLALVDGGYVDGLAADGTSVIAVSGGQTLQLAAWENSTATLSGGFVDGPAFAYNQATLILSGGNGVTGFGAYDGATAIMTGAGASYVTVMPLALVVIAGTDFAVDGIPVPYGDLAAYHGTLTGTLASGDTLDAEFHRWGSIGPSGTITLVPVTDCTDGVDNDGDGLIDLADPDCTDANDALEAPDADGDLVEDSLDNCVQVANPGQLDTDGDDYGNACDCDFDQNGVCNIADFSVFREDYIATVDRGVGTDMDGDGAVSISDFSLLRDGFVAGVPGPSGLVP